LQRQLTELSTSKMEQSKKRFSTNDSSENIRIWLVWIPFYMQ
jgi:hypothetical protein